MINYADWAHGIWPYLALAIFGFLPSEFWRVISIFIARGVDESSEILEWVRAVSTTLLAGVVSNILLSPAGALASLPLGWRLAAMGIGLGAYAIAGRSVLAGVFAGIAAISVFVSLFAH